MGRPARRTYSPVDKCLRSLTEGEVTGGFDQDKVCNANTAESTVHPCSWQIKKTDGRPEHKDVLMTLQIKADFSI